MRRALCSTVFAAILVVGISALCQGPQRISSIFGNFTPEQLNAINESRRLAQEELNRQSPAFKTPNIAIALETRWYLIAIAKIVSVQLPDGSTPKTIVRFHVEQLIRGDGPVADFDVESQWTPTPPSQSDVPFTVASNYRPTSLDLSEPKMGDRYILGFTLAYKSDRFVFVPGVIDLQDPSQAELIGSMERFLTIDSSAERSGFESYLAALEDRAPWIRDIAVHRLTSSEACNASPVCAEKFSDVVTRQISSDAPNERQQAVGWLVWVDSVSRMEEARKTVVDGLPILPDSKIRTLFNKAIEDPNVSIGDMAFQYREEFDFYRTKSPDDCFAIVPPLRRSAQYGRGGANPVPALFPLNYTYGCLPPKDSSH
jgi:hypothetical protein